VYIPALGSTGLNDWNGLNVLNGGVALWVAVKSHRVLPKELAAQLIVKRPLEKVVD
jgi:hypothetical protein